MHKLTCLIATFVLFVNSSTLAYSKNSESSPKQEFLAQADELSPLAITKLDLTDALNLTSSGNFKTAIVILKSSQKQIRKIKELDKKILKQLKKFVTRAISFAKAGNSDDAMRHIQLALDILNTA